MRKAIWPQACFGFANRIAGVCAAFLFALLTLAQASTPATENPFVGTWTADFSKSKLPPNFPYERVTLQIAVVFDTVTMGFQHVTTSGQEESGAELYHMDGKELAHLRVARPL
jgi:hypothetical protein